jgi:hypothetical protein
MSNGIAPAYSRSTVRRSGDWPFGMSERLGWVAVSASELAPVLALADAPRWPSRTSWYPAARPKGLPSAPALSRYEGIVYTWWGRGC